MTKSKHAKMAILSLCLVSIFYLLKLLNAQMNNRITKQAQTSETLYMDAAFKEKINALSARSISLEHALYVDSKKTGGAPTGSIEKPYRSIGAAINAAVAGDTILVREGVYHENVVFTQSGNEHAYITLMNYPGETPIIDGSSNPGTMLFINGQSYIHIEGFEIRNNTAKWAYGMLLDNGESHIIIRNNTFHDIRTTDTKSSENGANAIICYGASASTSINNIYIEGNTIYDCETGTSEAITATGNCENINVINNRMDHTGNIGIDFAGGYGYCVDPTKDYTRNALARGNVVSNCNSPNAVSYGIYADGARNVLFENNIVFDSMGGIEVGAEEPTAFTTDIVVRNNLIYNNSKNGLSLGSDTMYGGKVSEVSVTNNTIVNNGTSNGQINICDINGLAICNNILYTRDGMLITNWATKDKTKNISFNRNAYFSKSVLDKPSFILYNNYMTSFEDWIDVTKETGIFADPLFDDIANNNYKLRPTSPALGMGTGSI